MHLTATGIVQPYCLSCTDNATHKEFLDDSYETVSTLASINRFKDEGY